MLVLVALYRACRMTSDFCPSQKYLSLGIRVVPITITCSHNGMAFPRAGIAQLMKWWRPVRTKSGGWIKRFIYRRPSLATVVIPAAPPSVHLPSELNMSSIQKQKSRRPSSSLYGRAPRASRMDLIREKEEDIGTELIEDAADDVADESEIGRASCRKEWRSRWSRDH